MRYFGFWAWESFAVLAFVGLVACVELKRRTSIYLALFAVWCLGSALSIYAWPAPSPYAELAPNYIDLIDSLSSSTVAFAALLGVAVYSLRLTTWGTIFQVLGLVNAAMIIGGRLLGQDPNNIGLLSNASMSGCFQVCLLPLYAMGPTPALFGILLNVVSIFVSARSQPLAGFFLLLILWAFLKRKYRWAVGLAIVAPLVGRLFVTHEFFSSTGRTTMWPLLMREWWRHGRIFAGTGTGTFPLWGIMVTAGTGQAWTFLHSDWLQILFEQGVVGLILALFCFWDVGCRKAPVGRTLSIWIYGAWMVANMPLHFPLAALYGAFLIRLGCNSSSPNKVR